jgi:hypothetical protein
MPAGCGGGTYCAMKVVPRMPMVALGVFSWNFSLLRLPSRPVIERRPPLTRSKAALSASGLPAS